MDEEKKPTEAESPLFADPAFMALARTVMSHQQAIADILRILEEAEIVKFEDEENQSEEN